LVATGAENITSTTPRIAIIFSLIDLKESWEAIPPTAS